MVIEILKCQKYISSTIVLVKRNSSMVEKLKMSQNCVLETMKVNCILGGINKPAEQSSRLSEKVFLPYSALIKPHL